MRRLLIYICHFFVILFFVSCDDYNIQKTLTIKNLEGNIDFINNDTFLKGNITYNVQNNQFSSIKEIYFIFSKNIKILEININDSKVSFNQQIFNNYNVCRIKTFPIKFGSDAYITISYLIEYNYFFNTNNNIYISSESLWIPIPYGALPEFNYKIRISTPQDFYVVLGGKLFYEENYNNRRYTEWHSELNNALITGNIFILKTKRIESNNIYYYYEDNDNFNDVYKSCEDTYYTYKELLNYYPLTQFHILSLDIKGRNFEDLINAEFLGNIIRISPELLKYNENEKNNYAELFLTFYERLLKVISHEMAHAVIGNIIKFDNNNNLLMEILSEYMAYQIIKKYNEDTYQNLISRNRFYLINLYLKNKTNNLFWYFLYGLNLLHSAFQNTEENVYFEFINQLSEKYRFTTISKKDLLTTAWELNNMQNNNIIPLYNYKHINTNSFILFNNEQVKLIDPVLIFSNFILTNTIYIYENKKAKEINVINNYVNIIITNNFFSDYNIYLLNNYKIEKIPIKSNLTIPVNDINYILLDNPFYSLEFSIYNNFFLNPKNLTSNDIIIRSLQVVSNINTYLSKGVINTNLLLTNDNFINHFKNYTNKNMHFVLDFLTHNDNLLHLYCFEISNYINTNSYVLLHFKESSNEQLIFEDID